VHWSDQEFQAIMSTDASTEEAVLDVLQRTGPCDLDNFVRQLPHLSWTKMFAAMERLSLDGQVLLDRHPGSIYSVALPSQQASPRVPTRQKEPQP
jgi:hypothetical protein